MSTSEMDRLCINTIRTLAIDSIQKANSGHPGTPLGMAPVAYEPWQKQPGHVVEVAHQQIAKHAR